MRYMMMVKGNEQYEAGMPPSPELMQVIAEHTAKMMQAGIVLQNGGLAPSSQGAKVQAAGGKLKVVDGPFAEAKELIGGFAILQADSLAEAIRLGKEFMQLHVDVLGADWEGELEIRPMFSPEDCMSMAKQG